MTILVVDVGCYKEEKSTYLNIKGSKCCPDGNPWEAPFFQLMVQELAVFRVIPSENSFFSFLGGEACWKGGKWCSSGYAASIHARKRVLQWGGGCWSNSLSAFFFSYSCFFFFLYLHSFKALMIQLRFPSRLIVWNETRDSPRHKRKEETLYTLSLLVIIKT